ncbi:hypothetical protein D9758_005666 [Tetrapyrgos nigripes]|uniref:Uncharacterized protein n=1 Tax=Tetrapyrgos nigripes TaxID=182062 RepID=A0A8H5LR02_9AGAR|nr:hypothetical protein D9758_005666 [Tetrapyrgos nigripes]
MWLRRLGVPSLFLAFLSLVSLSSVSSVEARLHAKQNVHRLMPTVIAQPQWKPDRIKRDLVDVCIDLSTIASLSPLLGGDLELCLCLKDLNVFLDAHVGLDSDVLGLRTVLTAMLGSAFESAPSCGRLPAHTHRACTTSNPCHYECNTGYQLIGTQCVCNGCLTPSPVPRPWKIRAVPPDVDLTLLLDADVGVAPQLNTLDNDHPGRCQSGVPFSSTSVPTQSSPFINPSPTNPTLSPPSASLPSCPRSSNSDHEGLLATLHNILVVDGPSLQGLLGDLSLSLEYRNSPSSDTSQSDLSTSINLVANSSTSLASLLVNLQTELYLAPLLDLTNHVVEGLVNCLAFPTVDDDLAGLLMQTLAASQSLLHHVQTLRTGLGTCGCRDELMNSLRSGKHMSKRSASCGPMDSAFGITLPPLGTKVDLGGPLNKAVLGLTDSLHLEPIVHPARAYPISRDLLSSSDSSAIDVDANPLADTRVDLGTSFNGLVVGLAHSLGFGGLIHSPGSSSSSPSSSATSNPTLTADALVDLITEINATRLDLGVVLDALIPSSSPVHDAAPGPPSTSDPDVLLMSILDLGADLDTNLSGLNTDLSLTGQLIAQVGHLNSLLIAYSELPGLEAGLFHAVSHALTGTSKLLDELSDLQVGLELQSSINAKPSKRSWSFPLFWLH